MATCLNCGKKTGGFNNVSYFLHGEKEICGKCYDSLENFSVRVKYENIEALDKIRNRIQQEMIDKNFTIESQEYIIQYLGTIQNTMEEKEYQEKYTKLLNSITEADINNHTLTTGINFDGYKIVEYKGIVSGETVLGTGFLSEFTASWSDTLGTKSNAFQSKLEIAKDHAVRSMVINSIVKGGNALLGVDVKYITFQNNMIGVVATGTTVIIEQL
ncbi:MAG: heavy metal-binding domain-containing protein [Coprobacillaceae bacterium]